MMEHKIADGVRFVSVKTDKFKTSRLNFIMATPLSGNISAKAILPYLLHRRCAKYPELSAFNSKLDSLYGASVSAGVMKLGESLLLSIGITAIDDRFALDDDKITAECTELLTSMIFDPVIVDSSFPADIVEEEKRLLTEKLKAEMNDKRQYAFSKCGQIMFQNEAYGKNRYGSVEEIASLTPKDVYSEWLHLLKSATMQLTIVGSADFTLAQDILKKKLSSIQRAPEENKTEFFAGVPKLNYVSETQQIKQGKLVMGFRTGMRNNKDNVDAMRVAVDIFGGGTYSKLFSVVREKMSLCYYCSASLYTNKGVVFVQSGIENENEEKAKSEIVKQLNEVAQGNFTDEDFSASIKSMCDARIAINDTPEGICSWYIVQVLEEKLLTPEESVAKIRAVDKNQAVRAAKTIMLDTVFMLKGSEESEENED